jgi:hypothetical protein
LVWDPFIDGTPKKVAKSIFSFGIHQRTAAPRQARCAALPMITTRFGFRSGLMLAIPLNEIFHINLPAAVTG